MPRWPRGAILVRSLHKARKCFANSFAITGSPSVGDLQSIKTAKSATKTATTNRQIPGKQSKAVKMVSLSTLVNDPNEKAEQAP